ncbi:MAG: hypothetical protein P0Y58_21830 [Candidatus Pseudomonas phytovorans]|uniref:Uncharacterized protein n=1 Tax=Candidatus Pseudomonas phytovorans TaxID=3121377 RepID=A0AAJ5WIW3_9PSED|nr:hypothetical protein [Pseudomonas sp.]WEK29520.1 MAG: hypothetical protein P0Y58_21830 [Pseudomonas sp.]
MRLEAAAQGQRVFDIQCGSIWSCAVSVAYSYGMLLTCSGFFRDETMTGKKRVFLGFAAAPLIGGVMMGVIFNVVTFVAFVRNPKLMAAMVPGEGFMAMLFYPIGFEIAFLLPCLLLGLVAVLFGLRRTLRGCVSAGLAGGGLAMLWTLGIMGLLQRPGEYELMPSLGDGVMMFILASLACGLSACFALPTVQADSPAEPPLPT